MYSGGSQWGMVHPRNCMQTKGYNVNDNTRLDVRLLDSVIVLNVLYVHQKIRQGPNSTQYSLYTLGATISQNFSILGDCFWCFTKTGANLATFLLTLHLVHTLDFSAYRLRL